MKPLPKPPLSAIWRHLIRFPGLKPEEARAYQDSRIRHIVRHAYRHVSYYRRLLDRHGINPDDIRTTRDLTRIPITDKSDLQKTPLADLVADTHDPGLLQARSTSGSSGRPFTFRFTARETSTLRTLAFRTNRYYGERLTDKFVAVFLLRKSNRGTRFFPDRMFQALGWLQREKVSTIQPLTAIAEQLAALNPAFIIAAPGVLIELGKLYRQKFFRLPKLRVILTSGEVTLPWMKEDIRNYFEVEVLDYYSTVETGIIAWECRETGRYHVCDDSMVLEVVRDGRTVPPGERGEVVLTSLIAEAMPLIRYRLGDIVTRGEPHCSCGRPYSTIDRIQGRMLDYFVLPGGRLVHPYSISYQLTHHLLPDRIDQYRLVQESPDRIVFQIVTSVPLDAEVFQSFEQKIRKIIGPDVEFCFQKLPQIEINPTGKFRIHQSMVSSYYDGLDWDAPQRIDQAIKK